MILIIWHTLLLIGKRFHWTTPKAYFKLAGGSVFTSRKGSEHKGKHKETKHCQSTECACAYICVYSSVFRWNRHSCACHCVASKNLTWVVFIPACIQPVFTMSVVVLAFLLASPVKPDLRNFWQKNYHMMTYCTWIGSVINITEEIKSEKLPVVIWSWY